MYISRLSGGVVVMVLCRDSVFMMGFPVLVVKNPPANAGDTGSIPESGTSPRLGNDNPLQYSCLENFMDRGAWRATVLGATRVGHD